MELQQYSNMLFHRMTLVIDGLGLDQGRFSFLEGVRIVRIVVN